VTMPFYFADICGFYNQVWKKTGSREELILDFVKTQEDARKIAQQMNRSHWSIK